MSNEDDDFAFKCNIERFSRLLASEKDPQKRATLNLLLREERAKQEIGPPPADACFRNQ